MVENSTDYHIWNVDHWICSSSLPYYVESPGATIDLKELITVNDKEDKGSGSFSLTSVGIRQATGFLALKAKMTPLKN